MQDFMASERKEHFVEKLDAIIEDYLRHLQRTSSLPSSYPPIKPMNPTTSWRPGPSTREQTYREIDRHTLIKRTLDEIDSRLMSDHALAIEDEVFKLLDAAKARRNSVTVQTNSDQVSPTAQGTLQGEKKAAAKDEVKDEPGEEIKPTLNEASKPVDDKEVSGDSDSESESGNSGEEASEEENAKMDVDVGQEPTAASPSTSDPEPISPETDSHAVPVRHSSTSSLSSLSEDEESDE